MIAIGKDLSIPEADRNLIYSGTQENLHMSSGLGIKFVMNRNLVLAIDYGMALDRRDGRDGLYLNINYVF